jgi:hypothetical protein
MYPKGVPNNTTLLSHVVCPKSSPSHLLRWAKGKTLHLIYFEPTITIILTLGFLKKKARKCELIFEIFNLKM